MVSKASKASVRDRLTKTGYSSGEILFDGVRIGRFVSYGKGSGRGNVGARTVYGSRIYQGAVSIEAEAATTRVLLDKVAAELARAINAGKWPSTANAGANSEEAQAKIDAVIQGAGPGTVTVAGPVGSGKSACLPR